MIVDRRGTGVRCRWMVVLALCAGLLSGCPREPAPDRAAEAPAAAPFAGPLDQAPREEFLAYARSQAFDSSYGAGDAQALTRAQPALPGIAREAPASAGTVRIEPVASAFRFTRAELAQGRVLARLVARDSTPVGRFGLTPGGSAYWWVDSTGAGWRSVFLSSDPSVPAIQAPFRIDPTAADTSYEWRQSIARWSLVAGAEAPWITCERWYCCSAAETHPER